MSFVLNLNSARAYDFVTQEQLETSSAEKKIFSFDEYFSVDGRQNCVFPLTLNGVYVLSPKSSVYPVGKVTVTLDNVTNLDIVGANSLTVKFINSITSDENVFVINLIENNSSEFSVNLSVFDQISITSEIPTNITAGIISFSYDLDVTGNTVAHTPSDTRQLSLYVWNESEKKIKALDFITFRTVFQDAFSLDTLGSMAWQNSNAVNITGGTITVNNLSVTSAFSANSTSINVTVPSTFLNITATDATVNNLFVNNNVNIGGNLTVQGDLIVNGGSVNIDADELIIKDNVLTINSGEVGNGVTARYAGFEINRGTSPIYKVVFDELTDEFKIGIDGELQSLATREESPIDGGVAIWNASLTRFDTISKDAYLDSVNGVRTNRAINTAGLLIGGGTLNQDLTIQFAQQNGKVIIGKNTAGTGEVQAVPAPMLDVILSPDAAGARTELNAVSRNTSINTVGLLVGGGDLSANRTISIAQQDGLVVLGRNQVGVGDVSAISTPMLSVITAQNADESRTVLNAVSKATQVNTTGLLTGGGDLTSSRTITFAQQEGPVFIGRTSVGLGDVTAISAPMINLITANSVQAVRDILNIESIINNSSPFIEIYNHKNGANYASVEYTNTKPVVESVKTAYNNIYCYNVEHTKFGQVFTNDGADQIIKFILPAVSLCVGKFFRFYKLEVHPMMIATPDTIMGYSEIINFTQNAGENIVLYCSPEIGWTVFSGVGIWADLNGTQI